MPNPSAMAMVIEMGREGGRGVGGGMCRSDLCVCMNVCVCVEACEWEGGWWGGAPSVSCSSVPVIDEEPRRSFSLKLSSAL